MIINPFLHKLSFNHYLSHLCQNFFWWGAWCAACGKVLVRGLSGLTDPSYQLHLILNNCLFEGLKRAIEWGAV